MCWPCYATVDDASLPAHAAHSHWPSEAWTGVSAEARHRAQISCSLLIRPGAHDHNAMAPQLVCCAQSSQDGFYHSLIWCEMGEKISTGCARMQNHDLESALWDNYQLTRSVRENHCREA